MVLAAASLVWAAPKDLSVAEVSQKVEDAQESVKDVQMDLEVKMKDTLSGSEQSVRGVIQMKSPNLIYVHYTKPTEQYLYVGDDLMQMYQPAQKTVYQQKKGKKDSSPFYLGVGKELKRYIKISRVSIIKNTDSEIGLLFIPLSDNAGFERMKVFIHKKDWWPYEMEMETPSVISRAKFSNFSFNKGLTDCLFKFTAPKGTEVVEGAVF
jgi:outer membrane lipoprotein-sorting protein